MTEWTVERLDALPEGVVITWTETDYYYDPPLVTPYKACRLGESWVDSSSDSYGSGYVTEDADPGTIRVVSVPIDALLADETVWHSGSHPHLLGKSVDIPRSVLMAAVAHVTGGTP